MDRTKMSREQRAKQFAPFDALKGLQEAIRLKEYEHERGIKGDLPEEKILEISNVIQELKKGDLVEVVYFNDGYYITKQGKARVEIVEQILKVENQKIEFNEIFDLRKL